MRQLKITQQITTRESLSLNKYLQEVSSLPLLSMDEEISLSKDIKNGDEKALKKFVEANLRFVISVAKQYQGSGERLDYLISAGNEGLIIAAKRFDQSRGFKFISYAVWWIRQSIMQYLSENGKPIRLPANKISAINKIKNVTSQLEQKLHRSPTTEEIGQALIEDDIKRNKKTVAKFDDVDIEHLIAANSSLTSLDAKVNEDSEISLVDLIQSEGMFDINDFLKQEDLQQVLKTLLEKRLTLRERDVIIHSFGLFGNNAQTLEEIGRKFELTRERVRQIREKSIRKLKFHSSAKQIKEYI
jgi:RNA polymerase primary sigma factor